MSHVFNKFGYKELVAELLKFEFENMELPDTIDRKGKNLHEWIGINAYNRERGLLDQLVKDITALSENEIPSLFGDANMIKWLGSMAEFACLMNELAYRGYIESPTLKDGEMNKVAFAKLLKTHYKVDGTTDSLTTTLRGNKWSPKSRFVKVIEDLPVLRTSSK